MAGLGFDLDDFALFELEDPEERAQALDETILPKLEALGAEILDGLSRMSGRELHAHLGKPPRKKGVPPEETFVAFSDSPKGYRTLPHFALVITRSHVHARVAARSEADKTGSMKEAMKREAGNLSRKGKPFRKLRPYMSWDFEELPEIAPAHSPAFWEELADELANKNGGIDVGIAWGSQEARSLGMGDVLGAFRDLSPIYKLLANASPD